MRPFAFTLIALFQFGTIAMAANQEPIDDRYKIPVPIEQRKIDVGAAKTFGEGDLEVKVIAAERTEVEISLNGGAPVKVPNSVQTYVAEGQGRICTVIYLGLSGKRAVVSARCDPENEALLAALHAQETAVAVEVVDPAALVAESAKGSLTNPYLGNARAIGEGHQLYMSNSCNGCHGGTGGGGMGPAYSNGVWVYGNDDDTLFRLIVLGTDELQAQGYSRVAREAVVGPMPPYTGIIENADDLWKILAWVRSVSPTDAPATR